MTIRRQGKLIVVVNPLGLRLATVDDTETTVFFPVTAEELNYINWVSGCYDKLIEQIKDHGE
jgi:hypothetical protein